MFELNKETKDILVNSPDNTLKNIEVIKSALSEYKNIPLSESDTRCKLIDFIFKDVLFWNEVNIAREESYYDVDNEKVQYIDYIFESNSNRFLVEAKKSGNYFNTPTLAKKFKRTGVLYKDLNTRNALMQAYEYCIKKHIDVGCICNGYQLIVFITNSTEYRYDTYVFNSVDSIIENINDFINIFSPYSNSIEELKRIFKISGEKIRDLPQFSRTLNQIVYNSDEKINRNPVDIYIRPIINKFFTDLVSEETIKYLNECYCDDDRVSQYEKQLTSLLRDDIPQLGTPIQDSKFFNEDFLYKEKGHVFGYGKTSDVLILLGGVGAGKTTFIHRYFNFILPDYIRKNIVWIYIDFTKLSDETINIKNYILKEALKQIREKYQFLKVDEWETLQEIYKPDIIRLKNGVLKPIYQKSKEQFDMEISKILLDKAKNEVQFSEDILKYISMKQNQKKVVCLTIDNADQKTESFQIQSLKATFEFSKEIKSLVLLSLREESYWKLRNTNPFDAYSGYAYHISAPSVAEIIGKRIDVACKHIKGNVMELTAPNSVKCKIKTIDFFKIIRDSLYGKNNTINIALFEALSVNNLRYATEMLGTFLTSGHTNTLEYIQTYLNKGDYNIPFHAFVRSVSLGDYKYYHTDKSLIANLFKIDDDGFYSHFTKLRILYYLKERSSFDSIVGKGFIKINDIYINFKEICINEDNFRNILTSLLKFRLIQADNGYSITGKEAEFVKITSAGYYYSDVLLKDFAYLERLCEDTPILAKLYFNKMHELTNSLIDLYVKNPLNKKGIMSLRLDRVEAFLEYLKNQEQDEIEYIENTNIKYDITDSLINSFRNQSKDIINSALKYYI